MLVMVNWSCGVASESFKRNYHRDKQCGVEVLQSVAGSTDKWHLVYLGTRTFVITRLRSKNPIPSYLELWACCILSLAGIFGQFLVGMFLFIFMVEREHGTI